MARVADPQKIEDLKEAAIETIAKYGYRGTSIADIAKKANVSVGYLYRYYRSKEELITDIMSTQVEIVRAEIENGLKNSDTIEELFYNSVISMFRLVKSAPSHAQAIASLVLAADLDQIIPDVAEIGEDIFRAILGFGLKTQEFSESITMEDVRLVFSAIPFGYITIGLKESKDSKDQLPYFFSEEQARKIVRLCLNALK